MTKDTQEIKDAYALLRKHLKPGSTIYCVLRHVSRSGMERRISLLIPRKNPYTKKPDIWCIDYLVEKIGVARRKKEHYQDGLVGGCGMDMGFHLVYSLGRALYPKGFKLAKNQHGRNGDQSGFDKDGGYSFKHQWI